MITVIIITLFLTSMLSFISIANAHTEADPFSVDLIADGGSVATAVDVGDVLVWNDEDYLYVKYVTTDDWWITEVHLQVATDLTGIPQSKGNPVPGLFTYKEKSLWTQEYPFDRIPLAWAADTTLYIAAHAKVMDVSCYKTAILYGLERYTGKVYEIDVLTGTSTEIYDNVPPPPEGSATPNGLAYDVVNGRFYYTNYQNTPFTLYFWDANTNTEYVAGLISGQVAAADFWNGKYYYVTGPPPSDDLWEVTFNPDGTILSNTKLADIAGNAHGWTFDGDIAVKDGVIYGWGLCGMSGHGYEFFTYDLASGTFWWTKPSYQYSLQLAFGSNGILYGHRSGGTGAFYVVDTTTGAVTLVTPTPSPALLYTDCASGEICKPRIETAWGDGTAFPGKNWATYFTYDVQWVFVETINVYAASNTPVYSTTVLEAGKLYKIVASGTAYAGGKYAKDIEFDAEYSYTWSDPQPTVWVDGVAHYESYGPNLLDLKVEGAFIEWGSFNEAHVYEYIMTGTGSTLSLELLIYDIYYPNNSGYLTVKIYISP